ncbi:hypothetical protein EK21DRAFT_78862 [Setomelanomma holmii]|uniref:CAP-Gly domain-containing protein n=1 Tax=Setomelanomma holmii TaxID=210430 RepID=A0A9P4LHP4_9PLEO|nr:hypothetical protein EK21DRAFT_78862 [Setomelanomma holmii]
MSAFKVGQTVETAQQQQGLVKYVGSIHVAEGNWLGIELPTAAGKNDGSASAKPPPKPAVASTSTGKAPFTSKPAPGASKPRPSSVVAPKPTPRVSTINKRQSVAPSSSTTSTLFRAPLRKASTAISTTSTVTESSSRPTQAPARASLTPSTASAATKTSRDPAVETLQTKLRHLEKQHQDDQELLKELTHARDERDRYHGIIQKLQAKCQTQHQESSDLKSQLQQLQTEHDQLARAQQDHEIDLEDALVDKEMAEERADVAEIELEHLRSKLEERDMELDILQSEAELFTKDMTEEEKQEAGYYRLQHENDRLREALITLKEMTGEQEQDLRARIRELEAEAGKVETLQQENLSKEERLQENSTLIEHLQAQLDANAEWEDIGAELTTRNQELEDRVAAQDAVIRDLESLKELNDELEIQRADEAEDLLAELAAKDTELAEQARRIEDQDIYIAEQENLIAKFRELVFELQGRMADAESSRNMTEAQVKDTTGRFNEVMNLNRRLRASNVEAATKEITSELHRLSAEEATERLSIATETQSAEFVASEPVKAYFAAKSITGKASVLSSLLVATDRKMSYNGGLDEAASRLACVEAIQHLTILQSGSTRLWSAVTVAPLPNLPKFGQTHQELVTVQKALDQGLDALKMDEINFPDFAGSLCRTAKIQEAVLWTRADVLTTRPEDEILARVQNIAAYLVYLDSNFAVVNIMLAFLAANGRDLLAGAESRVTSSGQVADMAQHVLEHFTPSSARCNKTMLAAQKLLKTTEALRHDSLYPHVLGGLAAMAEAETYLRNIAEEAAEWGRNALTIVSSSFDENGTFNGMDVDLHSLLLFYWSSSLDQLGLTTTQLDNWIEEASLLINSSEIQHGSTPWSQKAKEVETERRRSLQDTVVLESLKAEHKTTLLSLHERQKVIETKNLEVEHLEAKLRDASSKASDTQQLRDKVKEAEHELVILRKQLQSQESKMQAMVEEVTRSDGAVSAPAPLDTLHAAKDPVEQPTASRDIPAGLNALIGALQHENHWLRRREHADVFDRNIRDMAAKMLVSQRWEKKMGCSDLHSDEDDDLPVTPLSPYSPPHDITRPKQSPVALTSAYTGWEPRHDTWLSIIDEEEEDDTFALEKFSEVLL